MEYFEIEDIGAIRKLIISNSRKKNALNKPAYFHIAKLLNEAAQDDKVKCVVLTGKGDFYSSGNDLTQDFNSFGEEDANAPIIALVEAFINFPKLLVCLVNGPAIGIAATTIGLADVVYCSENAYFLTPFTALGLCAEGCSSYLFPSIMGMSKASEMLMLNHKMTAQEAYKFGFVSHIYKNESEVWDKLKQIQQLPIGSIIANKKLIRDPLKETLKKVLRDESAALLKRYESEEAVQAIINFQMSKQKSKL